MTVQQRSSTPGESTTGTEVTTTLQQQQQPGQSQAQPNPSSSREYEERVVLHTKPCYVRYSLRGLGVFAGMFCIIGSIFVIIFGFSNFLFLIFGPIQLILGILVLTTEASGGNVRCCHCIFFKSPKFTQWLERNPAWVKPLFYILAPLPGMIFATTLGTVLGGGAVLVSGVTYAISLWKQNEPVPNNQVGSSGNNPQGPVAPASTPSSLNSNAFPGATIFKQKQTNINNNNNNNNSSGYGGYGGNSTPGTVSGQPIRPTFIDIRGHISQQSPNQNQYQQQSSNSTSGPFTGFTNSPYSTNNSNYSNHSSSSTTMGAGASTSIIRGPLQSIANYDPKSPSAKGQAEDNTENDRYENIDYQARNLHKDSFVSLSEEMGMEMQQFPNSSRSKTFYTNVDLEQDGELETFHDPYDTYTNANANNNYRTCLPNDAIVTDYGVKYPNNPFRGGGYEESENKKKKDDSNC